MNHLQAMTRLAGLGSAYCSKGLREPGVGQTNTEIHLGYRGMMTVPSVRGLGDAGASAVTMTAAQALDEHLTTNGCAGCDDIKSPLRQLTFAFKAAAITDPAISNKVSLNLATVLAQTGFGPGTDSALSLVLGASKTFQNGPCTDDNGVCLGNFITPMFPAPVKLLEQAFATQIHSVMQAINLLPQQDLVNMLTQGFAALINQIGFELAKVQPLPVPKPQPLPVPPPPQPLPVTKVSLTDQKGSTGWTTNEKITAGIAAGVVLTGVALVVYNATKG
jgi:hypothetical protein